MKSNTFLCIVHIMGKITIGAFLSGLLLGSFFVGLFRSPNTTLVIIESIQAATLTAVALFTAWWTSKTFGHQQKTEEAKQIKNLLSNLLQTLVSVLTNQQSLDLHKKLEEVTGNVDEAHSNFLQKRKEEVETKLKSDLFQIGKAQETFVSIKPYTSIQLLMLSQENIDSLTKNQGRDTMKNILELQYKITQESHFDIGIEWVKFKNKIGLNF